METLKLISIGQEGLDQIISSLSQPKLLLKVKLDETELKVVKLMEDFGEGHGLYLFSHDYLKVDSHFIFISLGSYFFDEIANGAQKEIIPLHKSINPDREVSVHQFEEIFQALETDLVGRLLELVEFAFVPVETFACCHMIIWLRHIGDYNL